MQTIKPSSKYVFAKADVVETKTASGILLPEGKQEKPKTGTIINCGDGVTGYAPEDHIIYKSYGATEIKLNGDPFLLINEEDILGKVVDVG